jgi:hypothetical protein
MDLEAISLDWEKKTGNDSIATIKRIYDRTENGAFKCMWPTCSFARKDAVAMWRHVHTGHGRKAGTNSLPPDIEMVS